ncbi:hypothetical protein PV797_04895 [Clostridiaceae bacterium M8S5]|nr:hypothetical protein PV797_04895 [Clostridiaceae bacterium M8S5]
MILKPTELTPNNSTFCKDEDITISWKNNGDIMTAYSLEVIDNSTSTKVYSSGKVTSKTTKHIIPANTLTNEKEYYYKLTVYNAVGGSVTSDAVVFKTSARPVVTIPNDGYVRNQYLTVNANYTHSSNVPIKSYKFILYDVSNKLIEESSSIISSALTYSFKHPLVDGATYKVKCIVVSQKDVTSFSMVSLVADYNSMQSYSNLHAETFVDKPYVKLQWSITRIIGNADKEFEYIDGEKANLTNGSTVSFDSNFTVDEDFTLKLWVENLKNDIDIIKICGSNGNMEITFRDNSIHVYKDFSSLTYHTASDLIDETITTDTKMYICIKQINNRLNIYREVIK